MIELSEGGFTLQEFIDAVIVLTKEYHAFADDSDAGEARSALRCAIVRLEQARAFINQAQGIEE